jgi:hypothetical protein
LGEKVPIYDLIKSIVDDLFDTLISISDIADMLGVERHEVNDPSEKCALVLSRGLNKQICEDFREIRRWVACRTWQLLDSGIYHRWRDAIRRAWAEAKEKCVEVGVII